MINKIRKSLMLLPIILAVACNGGSNSSGGGSNPPDPTPPDPTPPDSVTKTVVPSYSQIRTPVSANTKLGSESSVYSVQDVNYLVNNPAIKISPQANNKSVMIDINSNQWWSTAKANISIINTSVDPQSFSQTIVLKNASLNGKALTDISGFTVAQHGNPYSNTILSKSGNDIILTVTTPACSGKYCDWAKLAPNSKMDFSLNLGYSGSINNFNIDDAIINEGGTPPTPAPAPDKTSSVKLNLAISDSLKKACVGQNCDLKVSIISPSGVVNTADINASNAQNATNQFDNLLPGQYTVKVENDTIPVFSTGNVNFTISPSNTISIAPGSTTNINVSFNFIEQQVELPSLTIHLDTNGLSKGFENNLIVAKLLDSNGNNINTMTFTVLDNNKTVKSQSLVVGNKYTLEVEGLADPQQGVYYKPYVSNPITIKTGNTSFTTQPYSKLPASDLMPVTIDNSNYVANQTISYGVDSSNYSFVDNSLQAGDDTYQFPKDMNVALTINTPAGYNTSLKSTSGDNVNIINSSSSGQTYKLNNTVLTTPDIVYKIEYPLDSSNVTGIGSAYNLVITNKSNKTIAFNKLYFTIRTDSGFNTVIKNSFNGGVLDKNYVKGKCYGVNNGVCDARYSMNVGWNPKVETQLAAKESITLTGGSNISSSKIGGSTPTGLPLMIGAAHNIQLVNSKGDTYSAKPDSIYPDLKDPNPNKVIGGYFTSWANYSTPDGRMFPVESAGLRSFPIKNTNTVFYDLLVINGGSQAPREPSGTSMGDVALADNWADPSYLQQFSFLRQAHPWLNVVLSFGGWGSGSGSFSSYPSENLQLIFEKYYNSGGSKPNQAIIDKTAANMINAALLVGANGIDIDFEQGECDNYGKVNWCSSDGTIIWNTASRVGYETLLKSLYKYAQEIQSNGVLKGQKFIISTALPAGVNEIRTYLNLDDGGKLPHNIENILQNVTYANLMTYDYHGQFDAGAATPLGVSDGNAPLFRSDQGNYKNTHEYGNNPQQYFDISDTLFCGIDAEHTCSATENYKGYFALGGSLTSTQIANKLNLGLPTYARVTSLASSTLLDTAIYQPLASPQTWHTDIGGVVSLRCIYNNGGTGQGGYCAPGKMDELPAVVTLNEMNLNSWKSDSPNKTPWFYMASDNSNYFATFDRYDSAFNKIASINKTVQEITNNEATLNGSFVWEVDLDIPTQDSGYKDWSVVYGMCQATAGSTCSSYSS